ncbi:MAG: EVE domain-containing protein [Actinomycetota bacterium]
MKSEPNAYSIDDLKRDKKTMWDGVRNYQARNFMRSMAIGDQLLFYHSNCDVPGVVGLAKVVRLAYVDPTQFDPSDKHYDHASKPADPRWSLVDVGFVKKFKRTVSLTELKARTDDLGDFALTRAGNRLSVMSVTQAQFDLVVSLAVS